MQNPDVMLFMVILNNSIPWEMGIILADAAVFPCGIGLFLDF